MLIKLSKNWKKFIWSQNEKEMLLIVIYNIKSFYVINSHFTFHRDILEQSQHIGQQKCKLINMVFS